MSTQRDWQIKQRKLGNCIICGKEQCKRSTIYCNYHRLRHNECNRKYRRTRTIYTVNQQKSINDTNEIFKNGIDYNEKFYSDDEYFHHLSSYGLIF